MMQIIKLEVFQKEIAQFPIQVQEDIYSLVQRYLNHERLHIKEFKTFKIDQRTKIQEFKVKDMHGNWRAISCIHQNCLIFVYAFHKKSQELLERDKEIMRNRIKRMGV